MMSILAFLAGILIGVTVGPGDDEPPGLEREDRDESMKRVALVLLSYCEKCHKRVYKRDFVEGYRNGGYVLVSGCCHAKLIFKTSQEEFPQPEPSAPEVEPPGLEREDRDMSVSVAQLLVDIGNTRIELEAYNMISQGFSKLVHLPETEPSTRREMQLQSDFYADRERRCAAFLGQLLKLASALGIDLDAAEPPNS